MVPIEHLPQSKVHKFPVKSVCFAGHHQQLAPRVEFHSQGDNSERLQCVHSWRGHRGPEPSQCAAARLRRQRDRQALQLDRDILPGDKVDRPCAERSIQGKRFQLPCTGSTDTACRSFVSTSAVSC